LAEAQCTPSTCGAGAYPPYYLYSAYNLLGNEMGLWESGVGRYSTYDTVNRLQNFTASFNVPPGTTGPGTQNLLTNVLYGPLRMTQGTLGSRSGTLTETRGYNNRTWLQSIAVSSSRYSLGLTYYGNGNIHTANDSVNGNWTYGYDNVNRLSTASKTRKQGTGI
jgi:hypothetical protein